MPDAVVRRVLYLHGFASSAQSSKARLFSDRLAACGVHVEIPDLNAPSFETLTVSRMVAQASGVLDQGPREPVALIGSSLGAFVAVHVAARRPEVRRLVLLAPALDFASSRMDMGEEALARWRDTDRLDVFHYGDNRVLPVRYALYEDAAGYDAFGLSLTQPILIFHGTRDTVVKPAVAERFASLHPNVRLRLVDDDHQLLASMPAIWDETRTFLGLQGCPG